MANGACVMFNTILALAVILASFLTALSTLLGFAIFTRNRDRRLTRDSKAEQNKVTFLFDGEILADATGPAKKLLASSAIEGSDWGKLTAMLSPRFEGICDLAWKTVDTGPGTLVSHDGTSRLDSMVTRGLLRLELTDVETSEVRPKMDRHSIQALQDELRTLRATAAKVPYLNWRETQTGEIVWANRAYLDIVEIVHSENSLTSWPPAQLFESLAPIDGGNGSDRQRVALPIPGESGTNWFEVYRETLGEDTLFTAIPIDKMVKAEATLSEFVTTLTGTFAHLPIGLAIFDQDRKLSLFNPALTDLTMLPAEFLCGQPTLFAFLDALRDKRMMPEPKDYKTWRQKMSELEEKAVNGTYLETWFLPTGQTYRVTGRPHPGGAVAFLLEDITSEISLTHRFKAELDMGRSALDSLEEAIAIFTAGGVLSMANSAYAELWGNDPSTSMEDINISDATSSWNQKCNPTPIWRQLRGFIREQGDRKKWTAPVSMKSGRVLTCCFVPMIEGATMVTFSPAVLKTRKRELEPISASAGS